MADRAESARRSSRRRTAARSHPGLPPNRWPSTPRDRSPSGPSGCGGLTHIQPLGGVLGEGEAVGAVEDLPHFEWLMREAHQCVNPTRCRSSCKGGTGCRRPGLVDGDSAPAAVLQNPLLHVGAVARGEPRRAPKATAAESRDTSTVVASLFPRRIEGVKTEFHPHERRGFSCRVSPSTSSSCYPATRYSRALRPCRSAFRRSDAHMYKRSKSRVVTDAAAEFEQRAAECRTGATPLARPSRGSAFCSSATALL